MLICLSESWQLCNLASLSFRMYSVQTWRCFRLRIQLGDTCHDFISGKQARLAEIDAPWEVHTCVQVLSAPSQVMHLCIRTMASLSDLPKLLGYCTHGLIRPSYYLVIADPILYNGSQKRKCLHDATTQPG
jgi:hypothetical protein